MRSRPPLAAASAAALVAALATGLLGAPAAAAAGAPATAPSALLRGELRVLADAPSREAGPDAGTDTGTDAGAGTTAYLRVGGTGGVAVPLAADDVAGVDPGAEVTVRVAVPRAVVDAVGAGRRVDARPDRAAEPTTAIPRAALRAARTAPAAPASALAGATAVAAAAAGAPVAADVVATPGTAAATTATAAQPVVVAVVGLGGATDAGATDTAVDALLGAASTYWSEQTRGAVGFARSGSVVRYSSSLTCDDPNALWDEAARRAGFAEGPGEHLLLLLPPAAYEAGCSYGLGSVGAAPGAGGVAYVTERSWPAVAHELGHNMSLMHADRLVCAAAPDAAVGPRASYGATGCSVQAYGDRTDVMSSAAALADGTPVQATGSTSALELARLGLLGAGGSRAVTASGTTTATVAPLSALAGLRSLLVTDPRSGDVYDLEVRARAGRDVFGWGGSTRTTWGLRVLKAADDGGSLLLDPTPTTGSDADVVVAPGTTFTSAAGGVQVRTSAGADGAQVVSVSLARSGEQHWAGSAGTGTAAVSAAPASVVAGSRTTLPVAVTAGAGTARGWVTASEGSRRLGIAAVRADGSVSASASGTASVRLPGLAAGQHTVVLRWTASGSGARTVASTTVVVTAG